VGRGDVTAPVWPMSMRWRMCRSTCPGASGDGGRVPRWRTAGACPPLRVTPHRRPLSLLTAALVVAAAGLSNTSAGAIDGAALQKGPRGYWHIVMPTEMEQAVLDSMPGFRTWPDSMYAPGLRRAFRYGEHAAPFALILDLNHDGFEDVVLDGRDRRGRVMVLVISRGNSYRAIEAGRRDSEPGRSIRPGAGLWLQPLREPEAPDARTAPRSIFWSDVLPDDSLTGFSWSDSLGLKHEEIIY